MKEKTKDTARNMEESINTVIHEDIKIQKNLIGSIEHLDTTIENLSRVLTRLEEHEYISMHKSKWRIVFYNLFLGILFAIGTVLGLVILSWLTFTFFKDSVMLKNIVENQLRLRQFDVKEIRERAKNEIEKSGTSSTQTEQ